MSTPAGVRRRAILRLWAAELRAHRGRTLATAATLVIGAALLSAALTLGETMQTAVRDGSGAQWSGPPGADGPRGADVVVRTAGAGLDGSDVSTGAGPASSIGPRQVAALRRLPEVAALATSTRAVGAAQAGDRARGITVESLADDRSFAWQGLRSGRFPAGEREIAVTRWTLDELRIGRGDQLALGRPDVGRVRFTVVGVLDVRSSPEHEATAYGVVTPAVAQALAGVTGATTVLLRAARGVSDDALVDAVNARAPVGFPEATQGLADAALGANGDRLRALGAVIAAFAAAALGIAALVLATTTTVALASRRRTLALVRAVGASRATTAGLLAAEALAAGVLGALAGTALGLGLARGLLPLAAEVPGLPELGGAAFTVTPATVVVPVLATIAIALLAVAGPTLWAGRISPAEALRDEPARDHGAWRAAGRAWPVALAGGAVLALAGPGWWSLVVAVPLLVAGVAGGLPTLIGATARAAARVLPKAGVLDRLTASDLAHHASRAAAEAVSVTVAVALVCAAWVGLASVQDTASARLSQIDQPDLSVGVAAGSGTMSPAALRALREAEGVADAVAVPFGVDVGITGRGAQRRVRLQGGTAGVDSAALAAVFPRAPVDAVRPDHVYLPASDYPPYPAGARVDLRGPAGVARGLRVQYVDELPVPSLVAPGVLDRVARETEVRTAWLRLREGPGRAAAVDEATGIAVLSGPLPVDGPAVLDVRIGHAVGTARTAATILLALAVLVALIGMATTMALSVTERRRLHATLRALGLERRRLRALLLRRVLVVALVATTVGAALGTTLAVAVVRRVGDALDVPAAYAWPVLPIVALAAVALFLARLAGLLPLERASYVRPGRALADT